MFNIPDKPIPQSIYYKLSNYIHEIFNEIR